MLDLNEQMPDEPPDEQRRKEFEDWLPKAGDLLFPPSAGGAQLDPLGLSTLGEHRNPTGRWQLYSGGYLSAADRLVEGYPGACWEDDLIYPILNLYRHHLELELKYVIRNSSGYTQRPGEWLCIKHSLQSLWNKMVEVCPRFGAWASSECTEACRSLLFEFDSHDPTSQGARYPIDLKGNQTLIRLEVVNLHALKLGVHKISHYLSTIIEQIHEDREWEGKSVV